MGNKEKIQKIIDYKNQIDSLVHSRYHEMAQKYDLSLEQFHLLIELDELNLDVENEIKAPTVGEIAKSIKNSQNTVSEKVTRLENKGLVKRVQDSSDRRITRIVMTEDGRKLIGEIGNMAESRFLFDSISKMNDSTIDNLLSALKELINYMNK